MEGWEARIVIQSNAVMVRVEGMKAQNARDIYNNECPKFDDMDFHNEACELDQLARDLAG